MLLPLGCDGNAGWCSSVGWRNGSSSGIDWKFSLGLAPKTWLSKQRLSYAGGRDSEYGGCLVGNGPDAGAP